METHTTPKEDIDVAAGLLGFIKELQRAASDESDWWFNYFSARIALRDLALRAIASPVRDTHPDRRSIDFKQVSQDIHNDMKSLIDPNHGCVMCAKCGEMTPTPKSCIVCFVRERYDF